jgi:hypothetical protein
LGGIAGRWLHDVTIDPITKDRSMWQSGRLIITYKYRPDTVEEFCTDVLKQIIYCGGLLFPEYNKNDVGQFMVRNGYEGYLLYDVDRYGKPKETPGFYTREDVKLKIFNLVRDEIIKNVDRTSHVDWLNECCDIRDPSKMTDFDLFTSVGGTLLAEQSPYYSIMKQKSKFIVNTKAWITEEEY